MKYSMKNILLIGGSSEIGKEIIKYFNEEIYNIYSVDSRQLDILNTDSKYYSDWKDINIVINLSGLITTSLLSEKDDNSKDVILTNCLGAVNILNNFLPFMINKKYGRIIFISSIFSEINILETGVYSASKAFVDKLVKIAAYENGKHGITVNSIQLGFTGIGMNKNNNLDIYNKSKNKSTLKRFCTMFELYKTIEYLINTEYITGENLKLDGGIR